MKHKGKIAAVLAVVFGTALIHATLVTAQSPMPTPVLALLGQEPFQSGGKEFIRYRYFVANADVYPDTLFAQSPNLPPCGANTKAARTWVDFFDKGGNGQPQRSQWDLVRARCQYCSAELCPHRDDRSPDQHQGQVQRRGHDPLAG